MKIRMTWAIVAALPFAALITGCGNSAKSVCGDLADQCSGFDEDKCKSDGAEVEKLADEHDCGDQLDAYLDCASSAVCGWRTSCTAQHDALVKCTGAFPP